MIAMCLFAMMVSSLSVKAQEVTITLMPGWTWISVPITEVQDFTTTLGSFTPMTGDIIKSQWGNASYTNGQWRGSISQFYPGYGYMYKSTRTMPVTVTFNVQQPTPQVIVTTAEPTDITTNSAICGGNVASSNGDYVSVTNRGICWSTNPNPTFNDNYIESGEGIGDFTVSITGLTHGLTYYLRAFAVTENGTFYGNEVNITTFSFPNGAVDGLFSISATQQIWFSQGNLKYQASTNTWSFSENQYDYVGSENTNISQTYEGWIDLFGWGTSGWDNGNVYYSPWSSNNSNGSLYGPKGSFDLTGIYANSDWGVYNSISNGGNTANRWRTLTISEWDYVLNTRNTTSGNRYAKANVNGVNGLLLLPDNWNSDTYTLSNTNSDSANFSSNTLTLSQWINLEQSGVVFLPAAGSRYGASVGGSEGFIGDYWSATCNGSYGALSIYFMDSLLGEGSYSRDMGFSVRLVYDVQ